MAGRGTRCRFSLPLLLMLWGASPGAQAGPPSGPTPAQRLRLAPIERPLPSSGQVGVGRFLSARYTPRGPRAGARVGDYFVRSSELLAVLRASDGVLVDLAPGPRFLDGVGWGKVEVCQGTQRHGLQLVGMELVGGARPALEARARVPALGLEVRTRYHVPPGSHRLELESAIQNLGRQPVKDVGLCEELGLGNTRLQLPGHGEVRDALPASPRASFVARREAGVSYVLLRPDGRDLTLPLEISHPPLAFDPAINVAYERATLPPGEVRRHSRLLVARPGTVAEALAEALAATGLPTVQARVELAEGTLPGGTPPLLLEVRRDGRYFVRTQAAREVELVLPRGGSYSVAVVVPGAGEGKPVPLGSSGAARPGLPAWATLVATVVSEDGAPMPARLQLRGEQGSADPAFGIDEGLRVENVAYLRGGPEKLLLAPGRYRAIASRGPHYTLRESRLELHAGETRELTLKLRRVVQTTGWVGADLHLHTTSSFDSPVTPADRLAAAAAQGLELLVFTDHNHVTAGPPAASAASPVPLVISGQEVTSYGKLIGHFNVFPLPLGREIEARDTSPSQVFGQARARAPGALVQVNHPRMGSIGYFDQLHLDPASGRADPGYDPGFDLLEVLNGDQLDRPEALARVLGDWYQLLNRGLRYVATAGSDGHRLGIQEMGSPRTLILWDERGQGGEATAAAALTALRAGRAVASSGPFVRFSIEGKPVGSLLRGGEPLRLDLAVEAPAWMSISQVTLVANGTPLETFRPRVGEPRRLTVQRRLRPDQDTWYVVVVRGEKELPTLIRRGVLPFAVTNPIFVDVDGDGRCLPAPAAGQ